MPETEKVKYQKYLMKMVKTAYAFYEGLAEPLAVPFRPLKGP